VFCCILYKLNLRTELKDGKLPIFGSVALIPLTKSIKETYAIQY